MPYRAGGDDDREALGGSVVDDLVRQFADPYAFLRELVQNALDAGASRIVVRMERAERGQSRWSVEDDGKGMTLEIVEGPLLTAFSSSKESRPAKGGPGAEGTIGKYGVGFLSVFAIEPREVRVTTWRAEGALEVRLFPDHGYELRELPRQPGSGTIVTVEHPVPPGGDDAHEGRGEAALLRWCRHAARPIELHRPSAAGSRATRIDRPLALDAPLVVSARDGDLHVLVGPAAGTDRLRGPAPLEGTGPFAGFYNRGLTLFESTDAGAVLPGLRFKVLGPGLSHTLSRDDVKRDREHARALELVRRTAAAPLERELERACAAAAARASETGDFDRFDALLAAAWDRLAPDGVSLPLVSETGRAAVATAAALRAGSGPLLAARAADEAARGLVRRGALVARLPQDEAAATALARDLAAISGRAVRRLEEATIRLSPLGPEQLGQAARDLGDRVGAAMQAVGEPVASVRFAARSGDATARTSMFLPEGEALPLDVLPEELPTFRDLPSKRRALVLLGDLPVVTAAIRLADQDASVAAALLVRAVLLEHAGAPAPGAADALLELAAGVSP